MVEYLNQGCATYGIIRVVDLVELDVRCIGFDKPSERVKGNRAVKNAIEHVCVEHVGRQDSLLQPDDLPLSPPSPRLRRGWREGRFLYSSAGIKQGHEVVIFVPFVSLVFTELVPVVR